jgi:hypothetical protein
MLGNSSMSGNNAGGAGEMGDYQTPAVDYNIRHVWSEAIDLSEIRNIEDQTEFRSLRSQLGIDVSRLGLPGTA